MKKISIQGVKGAFHEEAANLYFSEEHQIVPQETFSDLVESVMDESSHLGIMAIENTISGTILPNYRLIANNELHIIGEVELRIVQNLGVLPGTQLTDIKEVRSHYMALNQCRTFLNQIDNLRITETSDTALSAKEISEQNLENVGAIASKTAMELYGLEILAPSIETDKLNFTRFFILEKRKNQEEKTGNKIILKLVLEHQKGSLVNVLSLLKTQNLNLTKIESTPILGKPWQYSFFIEAESESQVKESELQTALDNCTQSAQVLGIYTNKN